MPTGSIQVYASVAGQAAPLAGVQVAVLDESGVTVARLTTDEAGAAEATNLTAPNASYSLQETNTTVRPYAVYRLRADASGWQSQILDGVQVFDGQQTVARLEFLPGDVLSEVVVPRKITVHLGRPAASARNVTVSFQSYIANVASSEVYPTWVGHAVYSAPLPRRASRACTAAKSARETSPSWVPGTTIHCDRGSRTLRADL